MSEPVIRLLAFLAVFAAMAAFELWSPRLERDEMHGALKARRWAANLSVVLLSSLVVRIVFPAAAVGAALWAEGRGWGLFPALGVAPLVAGIISFVLLDFAVWLEHVASHKIPLLWRIHRMHHADIGFDVTTGLRFHPFEIVLSMVWKAAVVIALGAPFLAVLVFEIVLNATSMFNHSNVRLPLGFDRLLRLVLVTPDMHRVHHSTIRRETDSNYGFNFPFWDRIFRTYNAQPQLGHEGMEIGLKEYRGGDPSRLSWILMLPFRPLRPGVAPQKKLSGK
ncbi:sterol desaturase family protein [Mesorhizobium xinjiangense]|uniref:sterol desaturase family protein n=1 Tax=Mesorhizobium xinjiangense TaxID=2678685 RepID=UPI0012EEBA30|nr:sterol desaturase family protein [Mesorhizobium xinjiangense]